MGKKLVDPNKLCMGCMELLQYPDRPCPACGFYLPAYRQVANSLPPYEILDGKYLVGRVLGVGGFGITYIGWDFYQSKKVCIKEYFPRGVAARPEATGYTSTQYSMDVFTRNTEQAMTAYKGGLQSYIKEAENLSRFYLMPGIVSVRDFFYGNKTAYIVMEYIRGINLHEYAKRQGGRLEPGELFPLLRDVIYALNEVHKENIIHRDISPDNIMLDHEKKAKVIDFGAAKDYHSGVDSSVLLKHGYAPIEQYDRKGNQGPWTDVYSLCASIYYLLTGQKLQKAYERIAGDQFRPLSRWGIPVSGRQDRAITKGLSVQIEDRYQTMAELYHDLYGTCLPGEERPEQDMRKVQAGEVSAASVEEAARRYLEQNQKV